MPSLNNHVRENFQLFRVKDEIARSEHEWFAFVLIPSFPQALRTFIIFRNHVCAATWIEWRILTNYLDSKQQCDDKSKQIWISWVTWQRYEERWDLLGTPTSDIPVMLGVYHRHLAKNKIVDLPPGHPWDEEFPEWPKFWGNGSGVLGPSHPSDRRP